MKKFSLKGTPIFFLGQEILERARTIDEGIAICSRFRTIGAWAVNLISERENRAVTVELVGGRTHVRESPLDGPVHAHTNGHQAREFKETELHVSGSFAEDVQARKGFLERHLTTGGKPFPSVEEALAILGSHVDPEAGEERVFGNAVSVVTTIQSTAFNLTDGEIHVSSRTESPTGLGPYLTVPTDWTRVASAMESPRWTQPPIRLSRDFVEAVHRYHEAYCAWHMAWEPAERAREHLVQATGLAARDPHLLMQRGYFELMLSGGNTDHRIALECFDRALAEKLSAHHEGLARYFRGVCLDLLGERDEARKEYARVASAERLDQRVEKRAKLRLRKPFTAKDCKGILPDLQFVEPVEYS